MTEVRIFLLNVLFMGDWTQEERCLQKRRKKLSKEENENLFIRRWSKKKKCTTLQCSLFLLSSARRHLSHSLVAAACLSLSFSPHFSSATLVLRHIQKCKHKSNWPQQFTSIITNKYIVHDGWQAGSRLSIRSEKCSNKIVLSIANGDNDKNTLFSIQLDVFVCVRARVCMCGK